MYTILDSREGYPFNVQYINKPVFALVNLVSHWEKGL